MTFAQCFTLGLLALLVMVGAACAQPVSTPAPTQTSNSEPTAIPTPNVTTDISLSYSRSGGFVGLDDRLRIQRNGHAKLTRKTKECEFVLNPNTMNELQSRLNGAEFSKLRGKYFPSRQGSDLFTYRLTYQGHTVEAMDTAVPEALLPVLDLLNLMVEACGNP